MMRQIERNMLVSHSRPDAKGLYLNGKWIRGRAVYGDIQKQNKIKEAGRKQSCGQPNAIRTLASLLWRAKGKRPACQKPKVGTISEEVSVVELLP